LGSTIWKCGEKLASNRTSPAAIRRGASAACETVSGRQHSCEPHSRARNSASCKFPCPFRTQQACGAGTDTASATGANTATSTITNKVLAVKRCKRAGPTSRYDKDQPVENRLQGKRTQTSDEDFTTPSSCRSAEISDPLPDDRRQNPRQLWAMPSGMNRDIDNSAMSYVIQCSGYCVCTASSEILQIGIV